MILSRNAALHSSGLVLTLAVVFTIMISAPQTSGAPKPCQDTAIDGASFTTCTFVSKTSDIRMFLQDGAGETWGSFPRLAKALDTNGETLAFAMNGGMYHKDYSPAGLYVENGDEKKKVNLRRGPGNFHLMPNGVFFVGANGAGVLDTRSFSKFRGKIRHATQSGPMLVIRGNIHPKFRQDSESLKIRNGVGSCENGSIKFAISNVPVTFYAFASFFRDTLKCSNALFLDGSISSMYAPSINRSDGWRPMGPIVGVVVKKQMPQDVKASRR